MKRRYFLPTAFALMLASNAAGDTPQAQVTPAHSSKKPSSVHPIVAVILAAGENRVEPQSVKRWRGHLDAYQVLLRVLADDPRDTQIWRNALEALALVASGNSALAEDTFDELQKFVINDRRFKSDNSALGTSAKPMEFFNAAMFAKTATFDACGFLARYAPPPIRQRAIDFLEKRAIPTFWKHEVFQWPPMNYSHPEDRAIDFAVLSIRALRDTACSDAAQDALTEVADHLLKQKDPSRPPSPEMHAIYIELNSPSVCQ